MPAVWVGRSPFCRALVPMVVMGGWTRIVSRAPRSARTLLLGFSTSQPDGQTPSPRLGRGRCPQRTTLASGRLAGPAVTPSVFFRRAWRCAGGAALMAAASVTPPGSLDVLQPGFSTTVLGTRLEDKYLCSACRNVLRRPFQAQCGHRYCSFCLSSILRYGGRRAASTGEGLRT